MSTRDGTRLAYIVWLPEEDRPYPAVLNYSAYGESGTPFDQAKRFLEAGYAYVGVNVRGTGASEGVFSYFQPIEADDGAEVVEWIAGQAWSNGDVGMIGASYGGHTQVMVAALQPPHLKAIVPVSVDGCEYRDEALPGGLFNVALHAAWTFKFQPELASIGVTARTEAGDGEAAAIHRRQAPNRAYAEVLEHPFYDEWWRSRSLHEAVDRVLVPTLIIQAWQDEFIRPNGALELFKRLGCQHKRICLRNGPHRLSPYLLTQGEQMRWLNRWVKGEVNGVDAEPPVVVHWEVTEPEDSVSAAPSWTTRYSTWPVPDLQWVTWRLTATGRLSAEKVTDEDRGVRTYVYPLGTELIGSSEQFLLKPFPLGTLDYRSPPMILDTVLLGAPQLVFYFSCDQTDTDFMFTLKDIDSDGNVLFLQRTFLRASLRALDAERSSTEEIVQSFDQIEKLVPGQIYEVKVSLSALGHVLRKGHSLELSILSPSAVPNPVWGFASALPPSVNNVHHGEQHPSKLLLPIVPGEGAFASAPRLGLLRNQPWRPAPIKAI